MKTTRACSSSITTAATVPFLLAAALCAAQDDALVRASVSSAGVEGALPSRMPAISADGRYVAFESSATNLVEGDKNYRRDVFVHDLETGITERVSIPHTGEGDADNSSANPALSKDGRYVVFESMATNLVPGVEGRSSRIYVFDRATRKTELVSVKADGSPGGGARNPCICGGGNYVVFSTREALVPEDENGADDIYQRDRKEQTTRRISVSSDGFEANWASVEPAMSANGMVIAFESRASDLVYNDYNEECDIFVHDREAGTTLRISVANNGEEADGRSTKPAISGDGRFVIFESKATNLVEGDWNGATDIFLHDLETEKTEIVSRSFDGSGPNGNCTAPEISGEGRYIIYLSEATNLDADAGVSGTHVYRYDRQTGATVAVSLPPDATRLNGKCGNPPAVSGDGTRIAFQSNASGLVAGDTNKQSDIFVRTVSF